MSLDNPRRCCEVADSLNQQPPHHYELSVSLSCSKREAIIVSDPVRDGNVTSRCLETESLLSIGNELFHSFRPSDSMCELGGRCLLHSWNFPRLLCVSHYRRLDPLLFCRRVTDDSASQPKQSTINLLSRRVCRLCPLQCPDQLLLVHFCQA